MEAYHIPEFTILSGQVGHALADPTRLMILYTIAAEPRRVGDIADELQLPQTTVSRHLKILRDRYLVEAERQGHEVHYSVADARLIEALELLRAMLRDRIVAQTQTVQCEAVVVTNIP